jgi:hypothetical protein
MNATACPRRKPRLTKDNRTLQNRHKQSAPVATVASTGVHGSSGSIIRRKRLSSWQRKIRFIARFLVLHL